MNVLSFDSPEQMQQHLAAAAHHGLHPEQEALTFGSKWVQFHDITSRIVRFGTVLTREEIADLMSEQGAPANMAKDAVTDAERAQEKGVLYCKRFDFYHQPEGCYDVAYKAHVWPIDDDLFQQARETQWQIIPLPLAGRVSLEEAFRAQKAHVRGA